MAAKESAGGGLSNAKRYRWGTSIISDDFEVGSSLFFAED